MKNKSIIKYFCILSVYILSGMVTHQAFATTSKDKPILLWPPGGWPVTNTRSIASYSSNINASIDGSLLYIQCTNPTVDVTVRIFQGKAMVYEATYPAPETEHILIDLTGYNDGTYTLDLTHSQGGHVWGEFEL